MTAKRLFASFLFALCLLASSTPTHALGGPFVRLYGEDGQNPNSPSNSLPTAQEASTKQSYACTVAAFTPYVTPTDLITIAGSATKTIKVNRILLEGLQTTAGINQWFLILRGTADSGGTSTAQTAIALDPNNAVATASVLKYTAAPTINGTIGTVRSPLILAPAATSLFSDEAPVWDYQLGQPIVLRGVNSQAALNFNGAAVPAGLSITVTIFWTEE